jgi:hypothetical protein
MDIISADKLCHQSGFAKVSHPQLVVTTTTARLNTAKPTPGQLLIFTLLVHLLNQLATAIFYAFVGLHCLPS